AQLDRFLMKLLVEYPTKAELSRIVELTIQKEDVTLSTQADGETILDLRRSAREVLVAPHVQDYAIDLVMATQPTSDQAHALSKKFIRFGSSPRGAQALVECGRVHALMQGRFHLSVDDVRHVAPAVLRHRVILNFDAHAEGQTADSVLKEVIRSLTPASK
ncbi:MAG: AAA family ATPase, partial [Bryobacterales bacterium]|nr:AAA family ATPase [Bryobacterales bacterium]